MRGTITVESQHGTGSNFRVELPVRLAIEEGDTTVIDTGAES
jgi:chemotaxis protein histidine kinase CheA